jgi:hypothetical protein
VYAVCERRSWPTSLITSDVGIGACMLERQEQGCEHSEGHV